MVSVQDAAQKEKNVALISATKMAFASVDFAINVALVGKYGLFYLFKLW